MRCAEPPVEVEILCQEGRRDHPSAVMDEAFVVELAHSGVDDRVTGHAGLPGGERLVVVVPVVPAHVQVFDLSAWVSPEQLGIEVTPAELPPELAGTRADCGLEG